MKNLLKHREVETALRETEQQVRWLSSIVEASDDAIVGKHLNGTIASWNRSAERIFGYSPENAIGQHITPVRDANGKIVGALKIAREITEQKKKSQEMVKTLAVEAGHLDANSQTAMQYSIWALEHIEKADNQKSAHHTRIAFEALRKGVLHSV